MFLIVALLIKFSASQTPIVKVTYNSKSFTFSFAELSINSLKSTFNISDFDCLEDLSGISFYPSISGVFSPFISSEVYVRQNPPSKVPTIIYPTESKFVHNTGTWNPLWSHLDIGYELPSKAMRVTFINFRDLSAINQKRKIEKVYLRLVGWWKVSNSPTQVFTHRIESEWQGINNWNQHPVIREQPNSFRILRDTVEVPFLWDVTSIVVEWTTGLLPNYGISLKTNNTYGINTAITFYGLDPIKKPCLLVYYTD